MAFMTNAISSKLNLWQNFLASNRVDEESVPLFVSNGGLVATMPYGRDGRWVLRRSTEMDSLMRSLGKQLIDEFRAGEVIHDGILYLMFRRERRGVVPLIFRQSRDLREVRCESICQHL
jgi:hypothetical protein